MRLVVDERPGQNNNTVMIVMFMSAHITNISVVFHVTGHSFPHPDRIFEQIQRSLKKKDTILSTIYDFKSTSNDDVKKASAWPFHISL